MLKTKVSVNRFTLTRLEKKEEEEEEEVVIEEEEKDNITKC